MIIFQLLITSQKLIIEKIWGDILKDEFGRPFRLKEFFETLIVVIVTLFLVGIGNWIPSIFPFILLVLGVTLIVVFIDSRIKRNKLKLNEESKKNK